jgi:hypothetical protein
LNQRFKYEEVKEEKTGKKNPFGNRRNGPRIRFFLLFGIKTAENEKRQPKLPLPVSQQTELQFKAKRANVPFGLPRFGGLVADFGPEGHLFQRGN